MKRSVLLVLMALALFTSCESVAERHTGSSPVSHEQWDALLKKHVNADGYVNYRSFLKDSTKLNEYLSVLSKNYPDSNKWSENEQLAYWINAYNAYTVQIVLRHYPLESIKDIGSKIAIPFVNSVWDIKFIEIEGEALDLNNIEHGILRKHFSEPRIHFAINCASESCPKLRNEAFVAEKLEQQLTEQTVGFINDPSKNQLAENEVKLSKIFSWFGGDFKKESSLVEFLNKYSKVQISEGADVSYLDYDWRLNESKKMD
ncbi:DUF547 domain-containing protein [Flammeovirgaceae bacterium SG7u.111]|nr:DUF547 domain-containing protein [Flammeovirgaceae bacterium SG7u.132]WPO36890.1 DUF547 domain-containing protein [Flammeovirgaceae bacterium SG7u.111]